MTVGERLLRALDQRPGRLCDDCLTEQLELSVRQHANMQARTLERQGRLRRLPATCGRCGRDKLVNELAAAGGLPGMRSEQRGSPSVGAMAKAAERPIARMSAPQWESAHSTIVLVSCVKSKLSSAAPAGELYVSTLFREARRWAEREGDGWYILSAKYGLLHPDDEISPYEQTLKDASILERRRWAQGVREQLWAGGLLQPGTGFVWLAGMSYQSELRPLLADYPQRDPLQGMAQGVRVSWLQRANREGT